jgi:hypothetical protein
MSGYRDEVHQSLTGVCELARFKELCLDTAIPGSELGRFWAEVLGGPGITLCPVPEQKTVKNRVHLDVHADSVERLLALGASLAPGYGGDPWTVLLDPEGNEFCAFVRDEVPAYRGYELVLDTSNVEAQARWWGGVFGVEPGHGDKPYWWINEVPGLPFESIVFDPVPEPRTVKNRMHWDIHGDVDDLVSRGATHLWDQPHWTVLADPEGNEFCVFPEARPTNVEPLA